MQTNEIKLHETATKLAKEVSAFLLAPFSSIVEGKPLLNYADAFWLALFMNDALTELGIMPPASALLNEHGDVEPGPLEEAVYKRILAKAHDATPEQFRQDVRRVRELIKTRRGLRQLHIQLVRAVIPIAPAGRSRKITREQLPELAALSEKLQPVVRTFLEVQRHAPKSSAAQTLEYIREGVAGDVFEYLVQRSALLDREYHRLPKVGKMASRARRLADIIAGDKWGLRASYAVKMCKQARGKKQHRR